MQVNKELVKKRFKKSLSTYSENAIVQEMMADKLIKLVLSKCGNKFDNIFEIGCGTGTLTHKIPANIAFLNFYTNDIVEEAGEYIQKIPGNISFIGGDIEKINPDFKSDLIISNATFQWITNIPAFFKKMSLNLNNNGYVAFTTFLPGNLNEISTLTGCGLSYKSENEIKEIVSEYFEILYFDFETVKLGFNDPIEVLKHLKYCGTNALDNIKWNRRELNEFKAGYEELFSTPEGVSLTYVPAYVILKQP